MPEPDLSNLKRDAEGNILRSELLRINKPVLRQLDECQRRTVVRWLRGRKYWNAWAKKMLARRKELEEAGVWETSSGLKNRNAQTQEWVEKAKADFSRLSLCSLSDGYETEEGTDKPLIHVETCSFMGLIFPGDANFIGAKFSGEACFNGATFSGEADFMGATFSHVAVFSRAIFSGVANFLEATFSGEVSFSRVFFSDYIDFTRTIFFSGVSFWCAIFSSWAIFRYATFSDEAKFLRAIFSGDAGFRLATFEKPVDFSGARFHKEVDFSSIHSQKSFELREARFRIAPDFSEAAFHAPPVLDEMWIEDPLRKRGGPFGFRSLPNVTQQKALDVSRRFRVLGKMAHEARDWLNEMEFFAQEIRTRRFGLDFPLGEWRGLRNRAVWLARKWQLKPLRTIALRLARWIKANPYCGPRAGRFWFGWFYEVFSNFGRSFARPLGWWAGLMAGFAGLYAFLATGREWSWLDPFYLSVRHGLVVGGLVRTGHMQDVIEQMYGQLGSGLALLMMLQTVLSAFFLFLFFLAVRNHFRIR